MQWRLRKALSYRRDIDRFLCAKSFLMLEDMLRENFGLAVCPEFSYDSHGKPYIREYPEIFFNISHCHRGIACAFGNKPAGWISPHGSTERQLAFAPSPSRQKCRIDGF